MIDENLVIFDPIKPKNNINSNRSTLFSNSDTENTARIDTDVVYHYIARKLAY